MLPGGLLTCARANAGIRCWKWTGSSFGASFAGPELSDASGWNQVGYYATLRLADLNATCDLEP